MPGYQTNLHGKEVILLPIVGSRCDGKGNQIIIRYRPPKEDKEDNSVA